MKLKSIGESFISQKLREALVIAPDNSNQPLLQGPLPFEAATGNEPDATKAVHQPSGIPTKPRHRQFLGMERRPGSLRL